MRQYLEAFADYFGVRDAIQVGTRVTGIRPVPGASESGPVPGCPQDGTRWEVRTQPTSNPGGSHVIGSDVVGTYDAVMVCNGHYSAPRTPDVPGMDSSPCKCEHSHNYRRPEVYTGKRVLIVGAHASGAH